MQANGYITRRRTAAVADDGSGSVWQHGESVVSGPLLFVPPRSACAECIRMADNVPGRAADYNRLKAAEPSLNARVLVLTASPGVGQQYVATMNCIFSAQKIGVAIDTCVCADVQSKFLQQAAHITGGVYFEVPTKLHSGLLQFLLTYYLPDPAARPYLRQPPQVSWVAVRHALCG